MAVSAPVAPNPPLIPEGTKWLERNQGPHLFRMGDLVLYRWWIPGPPWKPAPRLTTYRMTEQDARQRFPGAKPEPWTREVRSRRDANCVGLSIVVAGGGAPR